MQEFGFEPNVLHLMVGEEVVLTIRNMGVTEHEWSIGQGVENNPAGKGYQKDLLVILNPEVTGRKYELEKASANTTAEDAAEGEYVRMISTEVDVEPRGVATLRFTVPASVKGEWEMGCFIPGHYESGMSGFLEIE